MKYLKNKNIKYLILPMVILTIVTSILITIQTYNQYKKVTITANKKIADIIGIMMQQEPEIDTRKIIEILNSQQNSEKYQEGQAELEKYGIDINETNSILLVQKQMKQNLISNIILIIIFNILWMIITFTYLKKRDRKIKQITEYINEIKNRKYDLDINENSEDELSNLKNELYKITVMLREESEISKKDKENIKMSVEDISHQLKTPLTSITIMLDNLKDNPNMDENTKQKFIFEISKQVDWINWLVISMLKLSKLDANVVQFYEEKINLKRFIDEIIKNLEIPIEIKNQQIVIEGNENASFIGDYKWQQEAVTNIIKNCIEHNKDNGNIFIKYEENTLFTKIIVRDEGEGISREDLKHIFERFYKGKNSSENSVGIGLALAKNIIEKNNGMISCKSELDKGTEFVIKYMK
ncbi:MAG: sensor histidine kinase [Clostridia bacterium]